MNIKSKIKNIQKNRINLKRWINILLWWYNTYINIYTQSYIKHTLKITTYIIIHIQYSLKNKHYYSIGYLLKICLTIVYTK